MGVPRYPVSCRVCPSLTDTVIGLHHGVASVGQIGQGLPDIRVGPDEAVLHRPGAGGTDRAVVGARALGVIERAIAVFPDRAAREVVVLRALGREEGRERVSEGAAGHVRAVDAQTRAREIELVVRHRRERVNVRVIGVEAHRAGIDDVAVDRRCPCVEGVIADRGARHRRRRGVHDCAVGVHDEAPAPVAARGRRRGNPILRGYGFDRRLAVSFEAARLSHRPYARGVAAAVAQHRARPARSLASACAGEAQSGDSQRHCGKARGVCSATHDRCSFAHIA
jgi:hypothetical protein